MSGSIKCDWMITKKNMSDKDQFEEAMNEDQEDAENLENTTVGLSEKIMVSVPPLFSCLPVTSPTVNRTPLPVVPTKRKQRAERNHALPPRLARLSATSPLPLTPEPSSPVSVS